MTNETASRSLKTSFNVEVTMVGINSAQVFELQPSSAIMIFKSPDVIKAEITMSEQKTRDLVCEKSL